MMHYPIMSGFPLTDKGYRSGYPLILSRIYKQIIKHKLHMVEFVFYFLCGILIFAITCIALLILVDMLMDKWEDISYRITEIKKHNARKRNN